MIEVIFLHYGFFLLNSLAFLSKLCKRPKRTMHTIQFAYKTQSVGLLERHSFRSYTRCRWSPRTLQRSTSILLPTKGVLVTKVTTSQSHHPEVLPTQHPRIVGFLDAATRVRPRGFISLGSWLSVSRNMKPWTLLGGPIH